MDFSRATPTAAASQLSPEPQDDLHSPEDLDGIFLDFHELLTEPVGFREPPRVGSLWVNVADYRVRLAHHEERTVVRSDVRKTLALHPEGLLQFFADVLPERQLQDRDLNSKERASAFRALSKCQMRALRLFLLVSLIPAYASAQGSKLNHTVGALEDYLNMAGSQTRMDFRPLTQHERNVLCIRGVFNPWGFVKSAMSAGIDQAHDKPKEWQQGWDAYGQRWANIEGQYLVQKTTNYLLGSALHEDNRYFGSGERKFGPRIKYALTSSVLAHKDSGRLSLSISQISAVAAGAFTACLWLPASQRSAGDGAVSFGITMGSNAATAVLKEFLPDILRGVSGKKAP